MLLPDTGTAVPHTRFPIGPSRRAQASWRFCRRDRRDAAGYAGTVLVRFKGKMQPSITLRDPVHAIPLYAIKQTADR